MSKKVTFSNEKVIKGVNLLCDTLKATIGPAGRNVIMDDEFGFVTITNDGYSISKRFELKDREMNAGVMAIRSGIDKMNDISGDGRTTVAVLAQAIVQGSDELLNKTVGVNPISLRKEIVEASKEVVEKLKENSKPCDDPYLVASTSAKSEYLGKLVADIYKKVGKDVVIQLEDSSTIEDEVIISEGLELDEGVLPALLNGKHNIEDCKVLLINAPLKKMSELKMILDGIAQTKQPEERIKLLVIANDFSDDVIDFMRILQDGIEIIATKSPGFANRRKEFLEDVAEITGGKVGLALENLGTIPKVSYDDKRIVLVGGDSKKRVEHLRRITLDDPYEQEELNKRIAKLQGTIAFIKVGAQTEVEQVEKRHHLKDAIKATKAALEEGVVKGGGLALYELSNIEGRTVNDGELVLLSAIKRPYLQIQENGFRFTETDVVDSLKVTRNALENAVSVATSIITTGVTMVEEENEKN